MLNRRYNILGMPEVTLGRLQEKTRPCGSSHPWLRAFLRGACFIEGCDWRGY